jgi:NADPH2:quinone reductase
VTVDGRVVNITRSGGPQVMRVEERAFPDPGPGEIRVRAFAAGVNFADLFCRYGLYEAAPKPPFVCGFEVCGVVDAVGEGVDAPRVGERVMMLTRFGGYAEYVVGKSWWSLALPDDWSFAEGAAFPTAYATAWYALFERAHLRDGMRVLVQAAAGGVGTAALQLCRLHDVEVFATASTAEKLAHARAHGAHHGINYLSEDFESVVMDKTGGRGVDVVLESVGGEVFDKSYRCLAPAGHLVSFGAATFTPTTARISPLGWARMGVEFLRRPKIDAMQMVSDNKSVHGFNLVYMFEERELFSRGAAFLGEHARSGALRPVIGLSVPFASAADATEAMRKRETLGRVVLTIGEDG